MLIVNHFLDFFKFVFIKMALFLVDAYGIIAIMEKGGGKKWLVVAISVLAVAIMGLIIGIVLVNLRTAYQEGVNEEASQETQEDAHIEAAVNDELYVLTEKLAGNYIAGNKDEAISEYKTNMDVALSEEDYDKFFSLLASVSAVMVDSGDCSKLMALYNDIDENKLPASQKVYFYGTAGGFCADCGDEARKELYNAKMQQLYDSGEVENYEN